MAKYAEAAPIVLKAIEDGETQKDAAIKAGISNETFHAWMKEKSEFSEAVKRARENARINAVAKVERSLLDRALGFDYEEVKSEYESKPDPNDPTKYVPTIKRQTRTKKRIVQDVEAIKFFLTNQDPENWKNRQDTQLSGDLLQRFQSVGKVHGNDGSVPTSEDDIPE